MKFISFVALGIHASFVSAATFKAPIYSHRRDESASKYKRNEMNELKHWEAKSSSPRFQQLLQQNNKGAEDNMHQLQENRSGNSPIWDWEEWEQVIEITVGTPPQRFHVLLSISDSDIFVPSSHCHESCQEHCRYQSKLSSTYIANGTRVLGDYLRFSSQGIISQDTVHIAGVELKNMTFGEAENFWRHNSEFSDDGWDGIMGLSYSKAAHPGPYPGRLESPFLEMVSMGLLDNNLFGLKLSRGLDDPGEIMFGSINHDLYEGELKILPFVNDSIELGLIQSRWKVPATSVSIGEGSVSLEGYAATLESDYPFISLPNHFITLLENYLGMERKGDQYWPKSINCSKRDELEDFTITLAGHDFVITPYEYTIELTDERLGGHRCMSAFVGMPDVIDEKYVIIGNSFLRAFYGVFDLDERTVSLGKLKGKMQKSRSSEGSYEPSG